MTPDRPYGWRLDPDCEHDTERGIWFVILPDGTRTAWNDRNHICPVCAPGDSGDCHECMGRGFVDAIPYCPRPWDLIVHKPNGGQLWLGGIHCQFGGVSEGPDRRRPSKEGNAFPDDAFDVVVSMLRAPGYEPWEVTGPNGEAIEHHEYRIADADLDAEHHTHLDRLAELIQADVESGKVVLVRCQAGINRSALVTGLVLIRMGIPLDAGLAVMRAARSPYVLFNKSFVEHLRAVEMKTLTPPQVHHDLDGTRCTCGEWQAKLGESIYRGFDKHLIAARSGVAK